MYEVSVRDHFDAAHYLRGYQGKCERLHGHRFQVVVGLKVEQVDDIGLAYDFVRLKQQLGEILDRIDHTCLNEIPPFDNINPSSENIAINIYEQLQPLLEGAGVFVSSVQVWESPDCCVTYFPK